MFAPATGWVSATAVARLRGTFEQRASQPNFRCAFAYQVANSNGSPGNVYELGSALTVDGFNYGALTDVLANTAPNQLVRFGWNVWYASGSAPLAGRVGGLVEFEPC